MIERFLNPLFHFEDLGNMYFDLYIRLHGEKKYREVMYKLENSDTIIKTLERAKTKSLVLNAVDYTDTIQSILFFFFASADTVAIGSLYLLVRWNKEVNSPDELISIETLKKIFISILLKCVSLGTGNDVINEVLGYIKNYNPLTEYYRLILVICTLILEDTPYNVKKYSQLEIAYVCVAVIEIELDEYDEAMKSIIPALKKDICLHLEEMSNHNIIESDLTTEKVVDGMVYYYKSVLSKDFLHSNVSIINDLLSFKICNKPFTNYTIENKPEIKIYLNTEEFKELIHDFLLVRIRDDFNLPEEDYWGDW
jgi:hypothetical protein